MKGRFYLLTRDLHLYLGLFISPFVLVFSISVFFLVHSWIPKLGAETVNTRVVSDARLPADLQKLSGQLETGMKSLTSIEEAMRNQGDGTFAPAPGWGLGSTAGDGSHQVIGNDYTGLIPA